MDEIKKKPKYKIKIPVAENISEDQVLGFIKYNAEGLIRLAQSINKMLSNTFSEALDGISPEGLERLIKTVELNGVGIYDKINGLLSAYSGNEKDRLDDLISFLSDNLGIGDFIEAIDALKEELSSGSLDETIDRFYKIIPEIIEGNQSSEKTIEKIHEIQEFGKQLAELGFHTIHQGKATNDLVKTETVVKAREQIDLYGKAVINKEDFTLFINKYDELRNGVRPTAKLLLDALVITATDSGQRDSLVKLPLSKYMEMRGLKDVKSAREQVREDIKALDNLSFEFKDTRKERNSDFLEMKIYGGTSGIVRGTIMYRFNHDFFNLIMSYPVMPYPKEILSFNAKKNPNSYYLLRRITQHKNMNYGKNNADTISVKTLLGATPEIPKYEDVREDGRIDQRIINPFERDMDNIQCIKWSYCGKNGSRVESPNSYHEFESLNIKIEWVDGYPERSFPKPKKVSKNKKKES